MVGATQIEDGGRRSVQAAQPRAHETAQQVSAGGRPEGALSIGEMCRAFDVTPRTLRFYETKELLFPQRAGQTRWFTRADRGRLKLILRGKRFGFSLEEMRQLLALYDSDGGELLQLARTYEVARNRLAEMERRRAELDEAISELKEEMALAEARMAAASPAGDATPPQR